MHARTTLSGTEAMLNNFADVPRSLKDPWEFSSESEVQNFDPDILLGTIMLKGSDLQPVFTDPRQFYQMNRIWWMKWRPTFEKWAVVLEKEYEPLWDRDGHETIDEHTDEAGTLDTATADKEIMDDDTTYSKSGNSTNQASGSDTTEHEASKTVDVTTTVSAFDANTYQPHDNVHTNDDLTKDDSKTTYGRKDTTNWSENGNGTDDRTTTKNGTVDTDTTGEKDFSHELHSWGNWGISQTVQKLKKQELDIQYWNLYDHISDIFLDEMTVRVF